MPQGTNLRYVLGIAALAAMFGAASSTVVYAQGSQDATGMTKESQAGSASGTSGSSTGGSSAASPGKGAATVGRADRNMMNEMAYSNLSEIEAGKIAQSKSQNDQVKNFAQRMIDDHTQAQQELQQLADAKGVKLPTEPDAKHKKEAQKLQAMSGEQFDKMYMERGGLTDHRATHQLLSRVQTRATDPDLKSLAAKTLPTIDQHLNMAQEVRSGTKSGASGSSSTKSQGAAGTSGSSGDTTRNK
ncbi:MAG TPA: DUF4142 domain-containing protein [Noviherbaspirillum sp.]